MSVKEELRPAPEVAVATYPRVRGSAVVYRLWDLGHEIRLDETEALLRVPFTGGGSLRTTMHDVAARDGRRSSGQSTLETTAALAGSLLRGAAEAVWRNRERSPRRRSPTCSLTAFPILPTISPLLRGTALSSSIRFRAIAKCSISSSSRTRGCSSCAASMHDSTASCRRCMNASPVRDVACARFCTAGSPRSSATSRRWSRTRRGFPGFLTHRRRRW